MIAPGTNSKSKGRKVPTNASQEVKWLNLILKALQNNGTIESAIATSVAGGATPVDIVKTGVKILNSNGESFSTADVTNCRSVAMTIITAGATGVAVSTDSGSETFNAVSLSLSWYLDKPSDLKLGALTITNTDAIVAVNYTYTD